MRVLDSRGQYIVNRRGYLKSKEAFVLKPEAFTLLGFLCWVVRLGRHSFAMAEHSRHKTKRKRDQIRETLFKLRETDADLSLFLGFDAAAEVELDRNLVTATLTDYSSGKKLFSPTKVRPIGRTFLIWSDYCNISYDRKKTR